MDLIIVESPTKAKTISKFLGSKYKVTSSFGHIRDLPKSTMGVDIEHNFEPKYVIPTKARKRVNELKKLAEKAENIILAPDEDREGEAIAWHLVEALDLEKKDSSKIKRIVFHEVTKTAIQEALNNPREINLDMVDAQQARRVLDRLVGYELSPFLWRKVVKGLSAGRVQSVAVRLIVEREREIQAFNKEEYWTIEGDFTKDKDNFIAKLSKIDNKTLGKLDIKNQKEAEKIEQDVNKKTFKVLSVTKRDGKKSPSPPFTTSSLQQQANNKLGFSAKKTMMIAQQLYEGLSLGVKESTGLITYMRTDSLNLSDKFLGEAKDFISNNYGKEYALSSPRKYKTKQKSAQEAHEAIRPTEASNSPEKIKDYLNSDQFKLYDLIWRRAVASQMAESIIKSTRVKIITDDNKYEFSVSGSIIVFDGFLKIYPGQTKEKILPNLEENDPLNLLELIKDQHFTEPPARYNDASLVKVLESHGIGRPSTYAPTISTILTRGYVEREGRALKPKDIAFVVIDLLIKHFNQIVDYEFTAKMENSFDEIAEGKKKWQPIIKDFYMPFKENLEQKDKEINKKDLGMEQDTDEKCDKCGAPMIIKMGRFGKFLACSKFPDCKNTKQINEQTGEIEEPEKIEEKCDKCGKDMVMKQGRFGNFLACSGYPDCKNIKSIEKGTGVGCPECGKGEIIEKKTRRGKTFYACNKYPACKKAFWSKPTGNNCKKCGGPLVYGKGETEVCPDKECKG
ncbi:type I DNA topoisomerase [Candidatus Falkowbacteria bacterium]|mgnify:CR=1 FL=1|jgi:DNA topoisomerase I|nr:type I DNA topoisomerase [Candidatus Falkowbacteria bacterium]MBT4432755.1 type I DNA topoisomerase [Candidatus Falkowbacteria bacterium]